jgi:hypothetical protein
LILRKEARTPARNYASPSRLWDPLLDAALANNELPPGLPRLDIHLWLGNVSKVVMRGLDDGDGDLKRYRSILRGFVAPAFTGQTRRWAPDQPPMTSWQ